MLKSQLTRIRHDIDKASSGRPPRVYTVELFSSPAEKGGAEAEAEF